MPLRETHTPNTSTRVADNGRGFSHVAQNDSDAPADFSVVYFDGPPSADRKSDCFSRGLRFRDQWNPVGGALFLGHLYHWAFLEVMAHLEGYRL